MAVPHCVGSRVCGAIHTLSVFKYRDAGKRTERYCLNVFIVFLLWLIKSKSYIVLNHEYFDPRKLLPAIWYVSSGILSFFCNPWCHVAETRREANNYGAGTNNLLLRMRYEPLPLFCFFKP